MFIFVLHCFIQVYFSLCANSIYHYWASVTGILQVTLNEVLTNSICI